MEKQKEYVKNKNYFQKPILNKEKDELNMCESLKYQTLEQPDI